MCAAMISAARVAVLGGLGECADRARLNGDGGSADNCGAPPLSRSRARHRRTGRLRVPIAPSARVAHPGWRSVHERRHQPPAGVRSFWVQACRSSATCRLRIRQRIPMLHFRSIAPRLLLPLASLGPSSRPAAQAVLAPEPSSAFPSAVDGIWRPASRNDRIF